MNQALDLAIRQSRILIVDDNPSNVALLESILDDEEFDEFVSTTDPRKVERLFEEWDFDLILLDIRMPHLDGFEVMERLGARLSADYLPVIVLTAHTDMETRQRALALGAKDFIGKPFEPWEVVSRIKNMLEMRYFFKQQQRRGDQLEGLVHQRTEKIRFAQREIVERLGRAAEYRDNETGNHVQRMSRACQLLAEAIDCNTAFCETLLRAAPMHDIGKIGIPDAVLLKPSPLTDDEFEIMKQHVRIGADILGGGESEILRMAETVALTHHEKWDGSGYPNGLAGEAIPLAGRIVAICDVFDALTSARPYKEAWPTELALGHMREQAGKHFDPELLAAFLRILPQICALRADFPED